MSELSLRPQVRSSLPRKGIDMHRQIGALLLACTTAIAAGCGDDTTEQIIYSAEVYEVREIFDLPPSFTERRIVWCNEGDWAISGGFFVGPASPDIDENRDIEVFSDKPSTDAGPENVSGWDIGVRNMGPTPRVGIAFAICLVSGLDSEGLDS
jgi:hypothetical protein